MTASPVIPKGGENGPASAWRNTGIRVVGAMPWGTHLCVFYDTKEDLLDVASTYFAAGLADNESCIWAISDPLTEEDAKNAIRHSVPDLDRHLAEERIEILQGTEWYLEGDQFDLKKITGGWRLKLAGALAKGFAGMRVSGNAFWIQSKHWKEFCEYEQELDSSLDGQQMIVLCTYPLQASRAVDILDVARAHQITIVRRNEDWDFLETPELKQAKQEIKKVHGRTGILHKPFSGYALLTPRERATLAQIARGASSKEIARFLNISPRTVEFHRANILQKLHARNTVDLMRMVLGESDDTDGARPENPEENSGERRRV